MAILKYNIIIYKLRHKNNIRNKEKGIYFIQVIRTNKVNIN